MARVVSKNKDEVCGALLTKRQEQRLQVLINLWGFFFYFNRSRFMKGVWGILRGSFNCIYRQTKETKYHKQWPSLRYYYRRIKQIIWSILREFILES